MSLFHVQEWFHSNIPEAISLVSGQLVEYRDQVVVGSLNGTLTVLDPGKDVEKRQEMSILVETQLNQPILQVMIGKFFPNRAERLIAVLHPKKLAYYQLISENQEMYKVESIFEHRLHGSQAFNMCQGNFGRSPTEQICVQTINCSLAIYEAENHVFTRLISHSIHPGPLVYSSFSESMITTSGGYLNSTKYNVLAAASSTNRDGKKILSEWSMNLGDTPIDIAVMGVVPVQPSILVLCKRALFCATHGGTLRYTIRLQCVAQCLTVYNTTSDAGIQLLIGTSTKTVLFYHDTTLVWAAQLAFEPISIQISTFGENYRGFLSILSEDYRVSIGYLGTEPSLFRMPVTETRYIDFDIRKKELRDYEEKIRKNNKSNAGEQQTTIGMKVDLKIDHHSLAYDVPDNVPSATINVSITGTSNMVDLIFHGDVYTPQSYLRLSPVELGNIPVTVFVKDNPACDHRCQITAITSAGDVALHELKLPLKLICHEAAAQRNAQFKFSLDATEPALDIEFEHENQSSLGLQPFGSDYVVSIFVSAKTSRYRVQSDSTEFCAVVIEELVRRIKKHQPDVQLKIPMPLHMFMNSILQFLEIEKRRDAEEENVNRLSIQMRHIETVLLTKLKSDREELMPHVNTIVNYSYKELLLALDRLVAIENQLSAQGKRGLRSILNLFRVIMDMVEIELPFDGRILDGSDQKLAERIFAVLSSPGDEPLQMTPEVAEVGRKLVGFCERGGNLAEIAEVDEEEDEEMEDEPAKGFEFAGLKTGALPTDLVGVNHID